MRNGRNDGNERIFMSAYFLMELNLLRAASNIEDS